MASLQTSPKLVFAAGVKSEGLPFADHPIAEGVLTRFVDTPCNFPAAFAAKENEGFRPIDSKCTLALWSHVFKHLEPTCFKRHDDESDESDYDEEDDDDDDVDEGGDVNDNDSDNDDDDGDDDGGGDDGLR